MATVLDVAEYILKKMGSVTAMKLQKLVYYSQAWSTVWDGDVIFPERIEAWANGPVCPALFDAHKGKFHVTSVGGDPEALSDVQKESVDEVIRYYGEETSQYLSDLTHSESPWKDARKGLSARKRGNQEITPSAMEEFYSS
ncbi:MAG: DUF4065 domain-containing protein [Magnetococcales bacterium]|nr:DUF4065 domain-containing protein [Magnetococcales bacterium]